MRTTLTLERDVAERIRQEIRRSGRGMKAIVNDALRQGLGLSKLAGKGRPFEVKTFDLGVRPGIDPDRMNQLVDELEVAERIKKYRS